MKCLSLGEGGSGVLHQEEQLSLLVLSIAWHLLVDAWGLTVTCLHDGTGVHQRIHEMQLISCTLVLSNEPGNKIYV